MHGRLLGIALEGWYREHSNRKRGRPFGTASDQQRESVNSRYLVKGCTFRLDFLRQPFARACQGCGLQRGSTWISDAMARRDQHPVIPARDPGHSVLALPAKRAFPDRVVPLFVPPQGSETT